MNLFNSMWDGIFQCVRIDYTHKTVRPNVHEQSSGKIREKEFGKFSYQVVDQIYSRSTKYDLFL